jgi:hypothetical protein
MSKKGKGKAEKTAPEGGDGLTGIFTNDFPIHCQQQGLPAVPVRTLTRPGAPPTGDTPTTPSVFVEEGVGPGSLRAIHLRNLLLEGRLLTALTSSLEGIQCTAILLWNVGLNDDTTSKLVPLVANCAVRKLALDGNKVSVNHVLSLLQTSIEHLSLKCCCLGDAFCEVIGPALSANTSLLSLDLSSNQITDEGVCHLARGLRLNRTLLSLGLAGNRVADEGVAALCKVLVKFPLTGDEETQRRTLLAANTPELPVSSSGRSSSGASLDKSGRGGGKGKKREESGKVSAAGKAGKGGKGGGKKGGKTEVGIEEPPTGSQVGVAGGRDQPLLDLVTEEDGQLWMSGNSSLAHLTLSCNTSSFAVSVTTALFPRQPCGSGGCGFTIGCSPCSAKPGSPLFAL